MPPAARIGPSSMAHTAKSYQSTPSSGRSSANSSTVQPNSKVHSRSYASATTRCFFMAQSYRILADAPLLAMTASATMAIAIPPGEPHVPVTAIPAADSAAALSSL
jgi:hypothetical protein